MGATIHLHYCMGKLVDWGLMGNSSSKCSNCGMKKSHNSMAQGCCKDEYKQIKNDKDQKISEGFTHLHKTGIEIAPVVFSTHAINLPVTLCQEFPKNNAPPRSCPSSLHIINCVFRI
jgi:hypothetical protein